MFSTAKRTITLARGFANDIIVSLKVHVLAKRNNKTVRIAQAVRSCIAITNLR